MLAWVWAGVTAALLVVGVVILASAWGNERDQADACWAAGGVPVQGDSVAGDPVVCLDRSVLIEVKS